jgi:hypothetical protein
MIEVLRMIIFLLFVALGAHVTVAGQGAGRRRAVNLFIAYAVTVSSLVAVTQKDAWPFSTYKLIQGLWGADRIYKQIVILGVDGDGREWPVDPMAWSPTFPLVVQEWLSRTYPRTTPAQQLHVARFLLERAEEARHLRARGARFGHERLLGPFTAPDWWRYRPVADVATGPFVGLRAYEVDTQVGDVPSWAARRLVLDYP